MKNSIIHLSSMEFYAHHGCFAEERTVGTYFKVDLSLEYNATQAAQWDDVTQAVNYQLVYLDIKNIMQHSVNLLETLCQKILNLIKEQYSQVNHATVTVRKINPALGGKIAEVSVTASY